MENKLRNFFKQRAVAWVVLVLAVAAACFWGFYRKDSFESRKKTELLNVKKNYLVCDEADILSAETETFIKETDKEWASAYNSRVAVATLPVLNKWSEEDYAQALGEKWGLGENDCLLLLIKDGGCYFAAGANVSRYIDEKANSDITYDVSDLHISGDSDGAVKRLFEILKGALTSSSMPASEGDPIFDIETWIGSVIPYSCKSITMGKLILWAVIIFIILSALKGSGRKGYDSGKRPMRPAPGPVPNTGRVTNTRYSSPPRVHSSSSSRRGPAGPGAASSRRTPAGGQYPGAGR